MNVIKPFVCVVEYMKNLNESSLLFFLSVTVMIRPSLSLIAMHFKCRGGLYPRSTIERFPVPDNLVSWSVEYKDYNPPMHTDRSVNGKPWADLPLDDSSFKPSWNNVDGNVSRISYMGHYQIVNCYPLNPVGRTGVAERGCLGRWGPNHAADPVVTRWKRDKSGEPILTDNKEPVLQFVAIKRGDTGEWALPGGMVDPGEKVAATAFREFQEEALNSTLSQDENWNERLTSFFAEGDEIYRGYVDDPRNTDNAWMETVAYNFHDESGTIVGGMNLNAGEDAVGVQWVDITPNITLYASHADIVHKVYSKLVKNNK